MQANYNVALMRIDGRVHTYCLQLFSLFRSMVESCPTVLISGIHEFASFYQPSDTRDITRLGRLYQLQRHFSILRSLTCEPSVCSSGTLKTKTVSRYWKAKRDFRKTLFEVCH